MPIHSDILWIKFDITVSSGAWFVFYTSESEQIFTQLARHCTCTCRVYVFQHHACRYKCTGHLSIHLRVFYFKKLEFLTIWKLLCIILYRVIKPISFSTLNFWGFFLWKAHPMQTIHVHVQMILLFDIYKCSSIWPLSVYL